MSMLRAPRVVYVNAARAAAFSLPTPSRTVFSFSNTPLSFQLRQQVRRMATTTSPPPPLSSTTPAAASTAASATAAPAAPSRSFFRSDAWAKTVGTVGALANWSIPLAAITHIVNQKDPATTIDPVMTTSLAIYSLLFMRWAIAITPANYPLLVCHMANEVAQLTQLGRYAMASAHWAHTHPPQRRMLLPLLIARCPLVALRCLSEKKPNAPRHPDPVLVD